MTRRAALGDFATTLAIAFFALFMVAVPAVLVSAIWQAVGADIDEGIATALMALVVTGGAALIVYFWRNRATALERQSSARAIRQPATWGWIGLAAATAFVAGEGVLALAAWLGLNPEPTNEAMVEQLMQTSPLLLTAFVVILAPAYEELLFRRVLFGRLWAGGRPWLGLVLSSAAFALMHEMPGLDPATWPGTALLLLVYGLIGATYAGLYWRTGTLWAPIAAHALNNGVALLALALSA